MHYFRDNFTRSLVEIVCKLHMDNFKINSHRASSAYLRAFLAFLGASSAYLGACLGLSGDFLGLSWSFLGLSGLSENMANSAKLYLELGLSLAKIYSKNFAKYSNFLFLSVTIWQPLEVEVYFIKTLQIIPFEKIVSSAKLRISWAS